MGVLATQSFFLWLLSILLYGAPFFIEPLRRHSQRLMLLGCGSLTGLCFFDLLPEIYRVGGHKCLIAILVVWGIYCGAHFFQSHGCGHGCAHHHGEESHLSKVFMLSTLLHGVADGMMLAVSLQFSPFLAKTVFLALLTHKAYESISISSIVLARSRRRFFLLFGLIYTAMFPLGVLLTFSAESFLGGALSHENLQSGAIFIMSLSLGGLLGCLVFDFLMPSFKRLREGRDSIAWFVGGLLITMAMIHWVSGG